MTLNELVDIAAEVFTDIVDRAEGGFTLWEKIATAVSVIGPAVGLAGSARSILGELKGLSAGKLDELANRLFAQVDVEDGYKLQQTQNAIAVLIQVLNIHDCHVNRANFKNPPAATVV